MKRGVVVLRTRSHDTKRVGISTSDKRSENFSLISANIRELVRKLTRNFDNLWLLQRSRSNCWNKFRALSARPGHSSHGLGLTVSPVCINRKVGVRSSTGVSRFKAKVNFGLRVNIFSKDFGACQVRSNRNAPIIFLFHFFRQEIAPYLRFWVTFVAILLFQ